MSVIFLERRKRKQFSIPPLCLIRLKLVTASKLKSFLFIKLKKPFIFAFYFKTLLIIKELIKHENKFKKKVFHDKENSENRFWEFSYFLKGFKMYIMNIYRSFTKWNYHEIRISWNALKELFHSVSSSLGVYAKRWRKCARISKQKSDFCKSFVIDIRLGSKYASDHGQTQKQPSKDILKIF